VSDKVATKDLFAARLPTLAPPSDAATAAVTPQYSLLQPALSGALFADAPTAFQIKTRLTLLLTEPAQQHALNPSSTALLAYDIVAVTPSTEKLLHAAITSDAVDLISFDFSQRLPFHLRITPVKMALAAGVMFEIGYSAALADPAARRQFIANVKNLYFITRGRNLVFSSQAAAALGLRSPAEVLNLAALLGLREDHARRIQSENCRQALMHAATRRTSKAVLQVVLPADAVLLDASGTAVGAARQQRQQQQQQQGGDDSSGGKKEKGDKEKGEKRRGDGAPGGEAKKPRKAGE
jgi:ribonuclease P/MRP protein subunit RPP1